jgi:hypothetical protein
VELSSRKRFGHPMLQEGLADMSFVKVCEHVKRVGMRESVHRVQACGPTVLRATEHVTHTQSTHCVTQRDNNNHK